MLGNDIVDIELTRTHTDWTRIGWLDKVCTQAEQYSIQLSENPFFTVWRIWSMKESAYKINIRNGAVHKLNPKYFQTDRLTDTLGMVRFGDEVVSTITDVSEDYIHTIAYDGITDLSTIQFGIVSNHQKLKLTLLEQISNEYSLSLEGLEMYSSDNRVPTILHNDFSLDFPISMSHHGKYGAYTFYKHLNKVK